jgi:phage portal protein BeeE
MGALKWLGLNRIKAIEVQDPQVVKIVYNGDFGGYRPLVYFGDETQVYIDQGFLGNHVIFTITDWVARKMASVSPIVYRVKNKTALKQYKAYQSNFNVKNIAKINELKKKAFEKLELEDHPLVELLNKPNPTQNWDEFVYGYLVYKKFVGRCFIKGSRVENSVRTKGFQQIYLLPAQHIISESGEGATVIANYADKRQPLNKIATEEVCVIKTFSPVAGGFDGTSIFKSARKLLQKSSDALDAETETMQNRGAKKIVFPNLTPDQLSSISMPSDSQESNANEKLRKTIKEAGNGGIALNSIPLGSLDLGLSPIDLNILASKSVDDKAWCSLFHVNSMVVLNDHESASYDTMQQGKVSSVTDGVIPELEALKNGLNSWLCPSYGEDLYIDFDYTEFPEMYEELFKVAERLMKTESVTINEIRDVIKYDAYTGENADKILVSGSKKILDDIMFDLPQVQGSNLNL